MEVKTQRIYSELEVVTYNEKDYEEVEIPEEDKNNYIEVDKNALQYRTKKEAYTH